VSYCLKKKRENEIENFFTFGALVSNEEHEKMLSEKTP
jgi:hypothetical protein